MCGAGLSGTGWGPAVAITGLPPPSPPLALPSSVLVIYSFLFLFSTTANYPVTRMAMLLCSLFGFQLRTVKDGLSLVDQP